MLRETFVGAGYREGETTQNAESTTLSFSKQGTNVSVFLMPTHSTKPSPLKKATMMQFHVIQFDK